MAGVDGASSISVTGMIFWTSYTIVVIIASYTNAHEVRVRPFTIREAAQL